jgi:MFS family permease
MAFIVAGLLLFTQAPVNGAYVSDVLAPMVLFGAGAGLAFPALMTVAMSGVTPEEAGLASGLVNTSAQVGGALGLAVLATLSASHSENLIADGEATASALTSGYHLAFVVGAALVTAAIVVAVKVIESVEPELDGIQEPGQAGEQPAYSEAA